MYPIRYRTILVGLVAVLILFLPFAAHASIIKVGQGCEFSQIQTAIDVSKPGDIIEVMNGTYSENVNITLPIILKGIDGPVVDARGMGSAIVISEDNVTLEGFHVINSNEAGIKVTSSKNIIRNNTASENSEGLSLVNSNRNIIRDNLLHGNLANFNIIFMRYDIAFDNDIDASNLVDGKPMYYIMGDSDKVIGASSNAGLVYCIYCTNMTIRNLNLTKNAMGVILVKCNNSVLENNQINDNKGGILMQGSENITIRNNSMINNVRAGLFLSDSKNITITGNEISNHIYGIYLMASSDNRIEGNIISGSDEGVRLFQNSLNNRITGNIVKDSKIGITAKNSAGNRIYLNDFENNARSADPGSSNFWNSTEPLTYTYKNNTWTNYLGNFWSDYSGQDEADGVGKTPYQIGSSRDWHPLLHSHEGYLLGSG